MTHLRAKHTIIGILESTAGGLIVAAFIQKIWWLAVAAIIIAISAVMLDEFNIEDEEEELNEWRR